MAIGVVINRKSRKNLERDDRAARLRALLGERGLVHETHSLEELGPILRSFNDRGVRYWAADGGDGTLHWMLRKGVELALAEAEVGGAASVALPLFPLRGGTLDVIANSIGINGRSERTLATLDQALRHGESFEESPVEAMEIRGIRLVDNQATPFVTYGFVAAVGGVGQRFYEKYYAYPMPSAWTIIEIVARSLVSMPVAFSPLGRIPGMPHGLRQYARDMLEPTDAQVLVDGEPVGTGAHTSIHVSSIPLDIKHIFRFFGRAEAPGVMQVLVGSASPLGVVRNLPRMIRGAALATPGLEDRLCHEFAVRASPGQRLAPVIDGEVYPDILELTFRMGPRLRVPRCIIDS